MSNIEGIEIKNIDHLGIVSGIIDSIGLVEIINEYCGQEPTEKISSGTSGKGDDIKWIGFCQ